jgi:hypothetical protein
MRRIVRIAFAAALAAAAALAVRRMLEPDAAPSPALPPPVAGPPQATGPTRDELYSEAQRLEIQGRSKMNKEELKKAVEAAKTGGAV